MYLYRFFCPFSLTLDVMPLHLYRPETEPKPNCKRIEQADQKKIHFRSCIIFYVASNKTFPLIGGVRHKLNYYLKLNNAQ